MGQFARIKSARLLPRTLIALALSGILPPLSPAAVPPAGKNLSQKNWDPKVECLTPTGRFSTEPGAILIMNNRTIKCPLQEGETTFIISFLKRSPLDRFTVVNENANVKGEMRIAVSNSRLPANSPKWIEVSGTTAFAHKRRFNLSMVGVEARFVKLSFRIEKRGRIASLTGTNRVGIIPIKTTLAADRLEDWANVNFINLQTTTRTAAM